MTAARQLFEERFWSKVDKNGPIARPGLTPCWVWTAGLVGGYGCVGPKFGLSSRAHRVAYQICVGAIPSQLHVLHRCDNPPCVNPDHLFLGTQMDNNADRGAKGRTARGDQSGARLHPEAYRSIPRKRRAPEQNARGEAFPQSRLTEEAVRSIREVHAAGEETCAALGKRFGVSSVLISLIVRREAWKHVS